MTRFTMAAFACIIASGCAGSRMPPTHVPSPSSTHKYAIFFGTNAHPCKILGLLQGKKLPDNCEQADQRVFVVGPDVDVLDEDELEIELVMPGISKFKRARLRLLRNPLDGKPFPKDTVFFAPGLQNGCSEWFRVAMVTVTGLESYTRAEDLEGRHFDYLFCHSNGCTEAMRIHQEGIISADHYLHMGSPWGTTTTFLPHATHASFVNSGDPVSFLGILRFPHIPKLVWDKTYYNHRAEKNKLDGHQDARSPQIFVNRRSKKLFPHALVTYFAGIETWVNHSKELDKLDTPLPQPSWSKNDDYRAQTKRQVRYGLPWLSRGYESYRNFNIQNGYFDCTGKKQRDCFGRFYANYSFAKHRFKGRGAATRDHVQECIDKAVPPDVPGPNKKMIRAVRKCVSATPS